MNTALILDRLRPLTPDPGGVDGLFVPPEGTFPTADFRALAEAAVETDEDRERLADVDGEWYPDELGLETVTLLGWATDGPGPTSTLNRLSAVRLGGEYGLTYWNDGEGETHLVGRFAGDLEASADALVAEVVADQTQMLFMPVVPDEVGSDVASETVLQQIVRDWAEQATEYGGWEETAIGAPRPDDDDEADALFAAYWARVAA